MSNTNPKGRSRVRSSKLGFGVGNAPVVPGTGVSFLGKSTLSHKKIVDGPA